MEQCFLCGMSSHMEKTNNGFCVQCTGSCGPYMITHKALDDLPKIRGRKQSIIKYVEERRKEDKTRCIRIAHDPDRWGWYG
jgi:hypothetical protein